MTIYTLGLWRVKEDHEEAFVAAWGALADRTKVDFPDASATLLRDQDDPRLFVSSGPWESAERVAAWRSSAAFTESVAAIREHLDSFEPHTMDLTINVD